VKESEEEEDSEEEESSDNADDAVDTEGDVNRVEVEVEESCSSVENSDTDNRINTPTGVRSSANETDEEEEGQEGEEGLEGLEEEKVTEIPKLKTAHGWDPDAAE